MRVTSAADYAVRALVEMAAAGPADPLKAAVLARTQGIPTSYLLAILRQIKQHKLITSRRGPDGGYLLARPAAQITVADVVRSVEGRLLSVREMSPATCFDGVPTAIDTVWIAMRGGLRNVLEAVTVADVATGTLPERIVQLAMGREAPRRA